MMTSRFVQAASVLFLGLVMFGPASVSAATMDTQQAILLVHIPIGGGQVFTSNFVFTATGGATTINVKCFSDSGNRIGPLAGVNIAFSASNQVSQQTPATLGVTTDPLFSGGLGWCWASAPTNAFNVQETHGATSDLTPGGLLNSASATFVGSSPGAAETTPGIAGVPFWTTTGGAQPFLVLLNPLKVGATVQVRLFDTSGTAQGTGELVRTLSPRALVALVVPTSFGLPSPPTSGSIRVTGAGGEYLGWYLQEYPNGKAVFSQIGIRFDDASPLDTADAP